jgi:hypothetical protein
MVTRNYHDLYSVDNTVYRPIGELHGGFLEDFYEEYFSSVRKAIDGGCGWRDYALTPHMEAIHSFYESLTEQQRRRYSAYEIKQDMPMFQLTIFRYKDQPSRDEKMSVSFGWGMGGNHSRVFMSSDMRTVNYFEDFFMLFRQHQNVKIVYAPGVTAPTRPKSRTESTVVSNTP